MNTIQDSKFKIQNLIICLLITIPLAVSSGASAAGVDDLVNRIQKEFSRIKDISGTFSQSSYIRDIEETQKYSGRFFIKKPSRMMWEYSAPRDEKVIINNTDTWVYKKSLNQVMKMKFTKKAYSQVPIALLDSLENISSDFDISMTKDNALQLRPKRKVGMIKTLVIETAPKGFPVKMFTIFDTYGNIIMIELDNIKINSGLDDSLFVFKVPPGAEVFDMGE